MVSRPPRPPARAACRAGALPLLGARGGGLFQGRSPGRRRGVPIHTRTAGDGLPPILNTPTGEAQQAQHAKHGASALPLSPEARGARPPARLRMNNGAQTPGSRRSPETAEPGGSRHSHRLPGSPMHTHTCSHRHAHGLTTTFQPSSHVPPTPRLPQALAGSQPTLPGAGFSSVAAVTCPQLSPARSTEDAISQLPSKGQGPAAGVRTRNTVSPLQRGAFHMQTSVLGLVPSVNPHHAQNS